MSLKVLIADPDWRFSNQATAYLESHAHLVASEARLKEAKAHAAHWRPDLVIMSIELADKGLLDSVGKLEPRPAVLLTGRLDRYAQAWKVWQRGGDELLMKPVFRSEELHQAIVQALEVCVTGERTQRRAAIA